MALVQWLAQGGPKADKHRGWAHPIAVVFVHYAISTTLVWRLHDWLLPTACDISKDSQTIAWRLLAYAVWMPVWRLSVEQRPLFRRGVLYEYCWLCNVTLVHGAFAWLTHRPYLATAYCTVVGIDQLLWYVDGLGFLIWRRFPVGVAQYLTWPKTSWITRITSTHHWWTLPVLLSQTAPLEDHPFALWLLTLGIMIIHVSLSRWMVPASVGDKYLNVNLSHELWKDLQQWEFLRINHANVWVYLWRLWWRWQAFNTVVFGVLFVLVKHVFHVDSPTVC